MTNVSLDRIASALGMTDSKTPDTHIWATVSSINEDGSYQVTLNGANNTTRAARLCNAYVGDRVMCVVSNGKVTAIGKVGGDVSLELLWENASPESSYYSEEYISGVDVADYDMLAIEIINEASSNYMQPSCTIIHVAAGYFPVFTTAYNTSGSLWLAMRYFWVSSDLHSVWFGNGVWSYVGGSGSSAYAPEVAVPLRIYGIKGVRDCTQSI